MSDRPSVARSARTVSLAVLGSRMLGLVREQVLALLFGASLEFDAFVTAFRIPNLLRDLFAEGALSAAFVTTFSQKLEAEGDRSAWRLANLVLNALLVVLGTITVVGILIAPWIVNLIAPGFASVPGKTELTVLLARIMFPFLLFVAIAALAMGILNAKHRFGVPASASMMFNLGSILGGVGLAFAFAPNLLHDASQLPRAMIGISLGTLIGGALQWLIQMPSLRAVGYKYEPVLNWRDPGFLHIVRLLGPSVLGVAAVQINVFVDNWFASQWNGGVTFLNCAFRLMQFPIGVFGVAVGVATLPTVSAHVARGDIDRFRNTLGRSIRLAFFLCVPSACGLAVLARPIISAIYEHGRFTADATAQTALCLQAFSVGLAGYAAIKVIAPTFYAFGDSRTPMFVALGSIIVNAALDYVFALVMNMRTAGLALSTSFVALVNFFLLLALMRRRIQRVEASLLLKSLARIGGASVVMAAAAYAARRLLEPHRYVDVTVSIGVALIVFGVACKLMGVEEFGELLGVIKFGAKHGDITKPQGKGPRPAE
ncbi:MAG TPA: murein biosynthesis integral membrane protein MurJ [Verrucomicrobiae bacterium]|nr:murein biosynthesis integral membrane protein MurJ [Verrucomicrobiae bacterium]